MQFPSYPYRFAPGQPGQPGQTPETRMNRTFPVFNLHISSGTRPGQPGQFIIRAYQDKRTKGDCRPARPLFWQRFAFSCRCYCPASPPKYRHGYRYIRHP